jgi:transcription antitermination factor NusG
LIWQLLYTKPHAEEQAELNLRRQGFATLLPRVRSGSNSAPLFPRYIFTGHRPGQPTACLRSTIGVLDIVRCGEQPARVPVEVIEEIRSRMNGHNVVWVGEVPSVDPLFAKDQRERVRTLERLVVAGRTHVCPQVKRFCTDSVRLPYTERRTTHGGRHHV